ncbi:LacI family DNA-binding transcriptional regulator [Actinotalea fermentans]|uniref:LacI family transcriptional regulator n=1 Tax=Actinotalea fermentans TaxID=43671 RepID=A0A511YYB0_9CELL|nr:LacI family DNA-binding transcriptional regulator [Actinotalea fermentans]KGM16372.1 LacI family transcriptional regulator [Actinotalea fermentans ATCC 43279 = JCM 9966 = DSM 3133]GEN80192.1 LacI family transcriptional regulator [Actinotalea fermentans]
MAATLRDVAQVAGVSFKTVSNVIHNHPHVAPETRARVMAAIDQLGYRANRSARSLRSGRTGAIGLAVPELSLAYFAELADEVITVADAHGVVVLIEQTGGDRRRELEALSGDRRQMSDGLLFSPLGLGSDDAAALQVDFPLVLLGERIFDGPVDHVTMENVEAARAATEHLIAGGRRRIAVIGAHEGERIGSAGLRVAGYRAALEAHGLDYDDSLVVDAGPWHRVNGAEAMQQLLARGVAFDAVFGLNDELALGALRVLRMHEFRVPQDVAIIGFDDIDEAKYSLPSLTTVDPGRREIARIAVELLLERIGGSAPAPRRELRSPFRIVQRESTGAPVRVGA